MKFELRDLYQTIVSSDLDNDSKVDLLMRIRKGRITDDYYLKGNIELGYECFHRIINKDNKSDSEPTSFTPVELVDIYKQDIKEKRR